MNINVNKSILKEAISNLEKNNQYFVIDNNLFSIKNINTLLKVNTEIETETYGGLNDFTCFNFIYNNENIKVTYIHEDTFCFNYVNLCKLITSEDVDILLEKSRNIIKEKYHPVPPIREVDKIFYNEALVFMASKINEDDKNNVTDDFSSKFELYKEKQNAEIAEIIELMNKLYNMLLNIKLEEN